MKIRKNHIQLILFLTVISLPLLDYIIPVSSKNYENRENRIYASFPEINIQHLDPFPMQFENFFNDHFNFRGELLQLNNFVKLNLYNESPHPAVIKGKNGWLYTVKYINSFSGEWIFSPQELKDIRDMYIKRSEWLRKRGILNYIVIIPSKFNVYPEFLPKNVFKRRPVNEKTQFIEAVSYIDNLKVIDLETIFHDEKKNSSIRLYHKTDQHWNEYGAFIAYKKIVEHIHEDLPEVNLVDTDDFIIDSSLTYGKSLANTILAENKILEMEIRVKPRKQKSSRFRPEKSYPVPVKFPYKNEFQLHYRSDDIHSPKILVLRDSYTNSLLHLLPESFSETVFIWDNWNYSLNEDIVNEEKPDIFLTLIIESNLPYILHKHPSER